MHTTSVLSTPAAMAVDIVTAAAMVGLSRNQFYRVYLNTKRVVSIQTGRRDRVIDVAELRVAYEALRAELPRSVTGKRAAISPATRGYQGIGAPPGAV